MKLHINGHYYELPQEVEDHMLLQFYQLLSQIYMSEAIPKTLRLAIKPVARHELEKKEKELNKAGFDGKVVRPVPGADPALRLLEIEIGKLRGEGKLRNVTLHIATESDSSRISAFAISDESQSQGGRFDSVGGDARIWQDSSGKDVRPSGREVVSY